MSRRTEAYVANLGRFEPCLQLWARQLLGRRLQGKLDAADLAQEALLEAHRTLASFRGSSDAELVGWLRQLLLHKVTHALRAFRQAKRDVALERSLEDALEQASARAEACLAAEQSTPSERAQRNEMTVRLMAALEQLPPAQREAVTLHHLKGWPVAAVARYQKTTVPAVAGRLYRGIKQLQALLPQSE
jgi:RNA polymerase sigma-70 factor (ECF subfamily)